MSGKNLSSRLIRVVLPTPEGPETMKRMPLRWEATGARHMELFYVLRLFADFFHALLARDHELDDRQLRRFGAHGVELADNLLKEKLDPLAHRALLADQPVQLAHVGGEPHRFLVNL